MFKKVLSYVLIAGVLFISTWAMPTTSRAAYPVKVGVIFADLSCELNVDWVYEQFVHDLKKTGLVEEVAVANPYLDESCTEIHMPTLAELQQYDVILVMNDPYDHAKEMGDLLADYYDAGGAVVTNRFFPMEGRWRTDGYNAYELIDELDMVWQAEDPMQHRNQTMVKTDPEHPILSGVETFDGGPFSEHVKAQLSPGAVDVARWSTSYPLVATKQTNGGKHHVALNFTTMSNGIINDLEVDMYGEPNYLNQGYRQDSDGAFLVANALQYAAFGEIYCEGCNDHNHCTAESCDPQQGCQSEAIPGYCSCRKLELSLDAHVLPFMTVRYEVETSCESCLFGCSYPKGCQKNIYSLYAVGSDEFIGSYTVTEEEGIYNAIAGEQLVLYTVDNGATWSTTPCGTDPDPVCAQDIDCDDQDPCTIDHCDPDASSLPDGCVNTPDPACSGGCIDEEAALSAHEAAGRAVFEETTDCSSCYIGCRYPSGCQKTVTQYYAVGSGDDLGTDPGAVVFLNSTDNGVSWSLGNCSQPPVCTESGISCTSDSECCSGTCAGLLRRTCE